jgi:hypothetical protein
MRPGRVAMIGLALAVVLAACGDDTAEVAGDEPAASTSTSIDFPEPAGEWEPVLSGESLGVQWQLFRTTSDQGGICDSLQLEPPAVLADSDLSPHRLYKGKSFGCGGDFRPHRPIQFGAHNQEPRSPYFYVVTRTDASVTQVTLLFSDGSEETATPTKGATVSLYPKTKTLERLRLGMADGTTLNCTVTWPLLSAHANCLTPLPPPPGG